MEQASVKYEFEDKVEEKPIIIVLESSHSENNVSVFKIKNEENWKSTTFHQGSEVNNSQNLPAVDTVDNVKRWIVSSSVILPIDEKDGFHIEPADISPGGVLLAESLKNEDTHPIDACELEEHTGQVAITPKVKMESHDQSTDSDLLISLWSSKEQFNDNSNTGDSQVKAFSEPTSITEPKFTLKALFKCQVCGNTFLTSRSLSRHNQIHTGERPYNCDVCDKTFKQSGHLTAHQYIHTGEKQYKCEICNKAFFLSSGLKRHQRIHKGEKPHKCDVCNKTFIHLHHLIVHQRIHTGEKPYKCDVCDKEFKDSSCLRRHQRIHTGEKPYTCDVCNKEFSQPSNLKAHHRVHTGEKPYKCDVCNKEFSHANSLKAHQRMHT